MSGADGIEIKGQPKDRYGTRLVDDFGRPYDVELDRRTMAPVGLPTPRFRAPFYVPPQYLTVKPDHLGRLFINFEQWLADTREAHAQRDRMLEALAKDMFPNNMAEAITHPEQFPALVRALGDAPLSERFVRALAAGNPWATGEVEADPHTLVNRRGARLFSDAEIAVLDRMTKPAVSLAEQMAEDAEEFALAGEEEEGYRANDEDVEEFAGAALTPRQRRRLQRAAARA